MWEISVLFQSYKRVEEEKVEEKAERCQSLLMQRLGCSLCKEERMLLREGLRSNRTRKSHRGSKTIHIDLFSYQEENRLYLSL